MTAPPKDARIFVAGHRGLVGSAIVRRLEALGYTNLLTADRDQLDLRDQAAVNYWFRANRPEYVFLVAGTVGGIMANSTRPAEFLYDNMMIHATVVHASHLFERDQAALPRQLVHLPPRGHASRSPRSSCSPGRSSPPTRPTPWPRSPASSCASPTGASTAATSSRPCPPTSTGPTTTSTSTSQPRAARAHPQVPRRQGRGRDRGRDLGHRHPAARVPPRRRPGRRLPLPDGQLRRASRTSTSAPAWTSASARWPR